MQEALPTLKHYLETLQSGCLRFIRKRLVSERQVQGVSDIVSGADQYMQQIMMPIRFYKKKWRPTIAESTWLRGDTDTVADYAMHVIDTLKDPGFLLLDQTRNGYGELQDEILSRHPNLWEWRNIQLEV